MYNVVLHHVCQHARVAMRLEMWEEALLLFADNLHGCGCPLLHRFGFIDGTMLDIYKPVVGQNAMYNGWKSKHKVKYQCVVLPNFMIGDWYGLAIGRANNATMLDDSHLVPRLEGMRARLGQQTCLYKDKAYPTCEVLLRAPKVNNANVEELRLAKKMSKYRESMEWIFGKLGELWPFVTDVMRKATGSRGTGEEDCVAGHLLQSVCGGRWTHGGHLGPSTLHVEGRHSSFSLGPLADSQRFSTPLLPEGGLVHDLFHASSGVLMVRVLCWWCTADVTSLSKLTSVLQRKGGLLCPPLSFSLTASH
eukprot:scaffold187_cov329-Pavlova_lutheri.AAC.6